MSREELREYMQEQLKKAEVAATYAPGVIQKVEKSEGFMGTVYNIYFKVGRAIKFTQYGEYSADPEEYKKAAAAKIGDAIQIKKVPAIGYKNKYEYKAILA